MQNSMMLFPWFLFWIKYTSPGKITPKVSKLFQISVKVV